MYTRLLEPDQICHTHSMVAKRGRTNRAYVHIPKWKKSFKTQHSRIPMDPAILAAIGRFIANLKILTHKSEAMGAETRNRRLFLEGGGGRTSYKLFEFMEQTRVLYEYQI